MDKYDDCLSFCSAVYYSSTNCFLKLFILKFQIQYNVYTALSFFILYTSYIFSRHVDTEVIFLGNETDVFFSFCSFFFVKSWSQNHCLSNRLSLQRYRLFEIFFSVLREINCSFFNTWSLSTWIYSRVFLRNIFYVGNILFYWYLHLFI